MSGHEPMSKTELEAKKALYRRELKELEAVQVKCMTCTHCSATGWCDKYQAAPPDDVQAVGCDEWRYDGVPF